MLQALVGRSGEGQIEDSGPEEHGGGRDDNQGLDAKRWGVRSLFGAEGPMVLLEQSICVMRMGFHFDLLHAKNKRIR